MKKRFLKVVWDVYAKKDLKNIYHFNKEVFSIDFATKVRAEILQSVSDTIYAEQWSYDNMIGKPYRRIVVGYYKIVYLQKKDTLIYILRVFDNRKDPMKLMDGLKQK